MKVIKYVLRLESKYGSVVNAPEDDPDLIMCRKLLHSYPYIRTKEIIDGESDF